MPKIKCLVAISLVGICSFAVAQFTRTSIPMGDALSKALKKSSLTGPGAKPFHIRVVVSEPANPDSPYQGTIEEWWLSPQQWRREVTDKAGMLQTIVVNDGKKTESDVGDYFPLWLTSFVTAVFNPVPNAKAWEASGATIDQLTMANGAKSGACAHAKFKIGLGNAATDAFANVCFDGEDRLESVLDPRYSMEFHDYRGFNEKQIPRSFVDDPEPGTKLVGQVIELQGGPDPEDSQRLFAPLGTDDNKFLTMQVSSQQMQQLIAGNPPIEWPTVRSGNVHGNLAIYISADSKGQVREAWPLNSDNAGLDDPVREQVRHWKLKQAKDQSGDPVQVDGGLGFVFDTKIDNPLPIVTGAQIKEYVSGCRYNPVLPKGVLPSGTSFKIRVSVNEQAKDTGESSPGGVPWKAIQSANLNSVSCHYKPYLVNGKPTYYFIDFEFTAP
jgi:hypothetical protein